MPYTLRSHITIKNEVNATCVPQNALAIWSLGQAGFILKNHGNDILVIDPYLTNSIEVNKPGTEFVRSFPPVLEPEDIACADVIIITHHHDDHLDLSTLNRVVNVNDNIPIYLPTFDAEALQHSDNLLKKNVIPTNASETLKVGNFIIKPIPSAHSEYERDINGHDRYLGYLINTDNLSFYHSGDTLVTPELVRQLSSLLPDIVALPINGGDFSRINRGVIPNMSFRDAADLYYQVSADLLLPFHFDLFPCNIDNPAYLVDYLFTKYPGLKFHLAMPGERFIYMK